jgi:hypothetical protein
MIKVYFLEPEALSFGKSCPFKQGPTNEFKDATEPLETS